MANQRSKDKVKVQTYLHKDDEKLLREAAKSNGYANLADFLQAVARGVVRVSPHIKAIALTAIGTQSGGAGCLWFIIAIPAALWFIL